ncbi:probable LRR receptor-like serine/threonine-protein kinase At3g47570 [Lolium perenne]|uniref:probable LRR receptor-like serine/threonine-protein kinase At3g47570 n=1 Tax=Lolium perenne TaxID=4522 RepID=UPI0021F61EBF|nr:probable LRR receptor-like serine/threonine-protein kinase At3g47570 [Lolium perenne]
MDLSRNNLSGQIPDFFEAFSSMSLLNLSFNNLEGPVPTGGVFQNASKVFVQGNKELCAVSSPLKLPRCRTTASEHKHTSNILKIVGFSSLSLVLLSCIGFIFLKKRNKVKQETLPSIKGFKKIAYADIVKATNCFSLANLVGSGNYGSVYKGRIGSEEHAVAIKVFKLDQLGATKSFLAECEALRNTRHHNLVRVITVCSTIDRAGHDFKALVLEYMVNDNLKSWLHPAPHEHPLRRPLSLGSRIVRASLAEPIKRRTEKHEFSAPNSCLRAAGRRTEPVSKTEKQNILFFNFGLRSLFYASRFRTRKRQGFS